MSVVKVTSNRMQSARILAFSPIPMIDRMDHPPVPTTFSLAHGGAGGGQGWSEGHCVAASSVLEGHPAPVQRWRQEGPRSHFRFPRSYRGIGKWNWKPIKKRYDKIPSTIVILPSTLTGTDPLLLTGIDPASAHRFMVSRRDQAISDLP